MHSVARPLPMYTYTDELGETTGTACRAPNARAVRRRRVQLLGRRRRGARKRTKTRCA